MRIETQVLGNKIPSTDTSKSKYNRQREELNITLTNTD